MLWLITGESSHEIISCNTIFRDGKHQIWVERPNGKTMKVGESSEQQEVHDIKDAIDYAIENGHKVLNLNK
jgi:hypothetical protein